VAEELGRLGAAVEKSLEAATWLSGADEATKELARGYASYVDNAHALADPELIHKAYSVAGPNLQKTLTSLGLNPEARKELGVKGEAQEVDPIDELKRKRAGRAQAG
jgi:phage terminase small subunit